jgi:hypothetical protein
MIPPEDAALMEALRNEATRLEAQASSMEFDAMDLRLQAKEIESKYEYQGPCIGCPRYQSCRLSGSCAAIDRCQMARELAGVAE